MHFIAISGCGLIIAGYLALGFHYYYEAKHYASQPPVKVTQNTKQSK
jgi:hypothetical protein